MTREQFIDAIRGINTYELTQLLDVVSDELDDRAEDVTLAFLRKHSYEAQEAEYYEQIEAEYF